MAKYSHQILKQNIAGFVDALGIFRPIRSGNDKQGNFLPGYDPELAGDKDNEFQKFDRQDKNELKREDIYKKRQLNDALDSALGDERKVTLSQYVKRIGGLFYDPKYTNVHNGELKNLSFKQSGKRGIAHAKGKYDLDDARESADQSGYAGLDGLPLSTVNDFLDALEADLGGRKKIYPFGSLGAYKYNPAKTQDLQKFFEGNVKIGLRFKPAVKISKEFLPNLKTAVKNGVCEMDQHGDQLFAIRLKNNPMKANKKAPATKTAKPKENSALTVFTTASVGISAALNVFDRLTRNTATPVAKTVPLKHNKGAVNAAARAQHDKEYNQLLNRIEKGELNQQEAAKRKGKLAGEETNEIGRAIQSARLTYLLTLKKNPATAEDLAKIENLFKPNGFVKRAWARQKAGNAYKRELRLLAGVERARKRRGDYEAKAKKNPVKQKAFTVELQHATNRNTKSIVVKSTTKAAAEKKAVRDNKGFLIVSVVPGQLRANSSKAYEDFQGRPTTKEMHLATPEDAPKTLYCLGKLFELRLRAKDNINFRKSVTGKDFYLCADEKNKQLWIAGGRVAKPDSSIKRAHSEIHAKITHVIYETEKTHMGDKANQGYIHRFGDEGGEQPVLSFDRDGFAIIVGGDYTITPGGIAD